MSTHAVSPPIESVHHTLRRGSAWILLAILIIAVYFRFQNLNWDSGYHLQPDERYMTMAGTAITIPPSIGSYFNTAKSPLNPANVGYQYYVYGGFPLIVNRIVGALTHNTQYDTLVMQGRALSAGFDVLTLILIYKLSCLLESVYGARRGLRYIAPFMYAIAVLPIQLAHFYTADIFLTFFMTGAAYVSLRYAAFGRMRDAILCAIFFGMAVACKVSAVYVAPVTLFFLTVGTVDDVSHGSFEKIKQSLFESAVMLSIFILMTYLVVRVASPYYFATANPLDLRLSSQFITNLQILKTSSAPDAWYPPSVQWLHKAPVVFVLQNIMKFGLGIPYFLLMLGGIVSFSARAVGRGERGLKLLVIPAFVVLFTVYQSVQFVKAMRYFIFLYPWFAVFAGYGFLSLVHASRRSKRWVAGGLVAAVMVWPLAFNAIYLHPHTRVAATQWVYRHMKPRSLIAYEYWDDAIPLATPKPQTTYAMVKLPVFDQDTKKKWDTMAMNLANSEYYILSSNRGWGSIMAAPERYPHMSQYYADLMANRTPYRLVREFHSYPSLRYLGISLDFPDQSAEEAFTVYDHPLVKIYKNTSY